METQMRRRQPSGLQRQRSVPRGRIVAFTAIFFVVVLGVVIGILYSQGYIVLFIGFVCLSSAFVLLRLFVPLTASSNVTRSFRKTLYRSMARSLLTSSHVVQPRQSDKMISSSIWELPVFHSTAAIEQCEETVKHVYDLLNDPDIRIIVIRGIEGAGKSILAALICEYVEKQRVTGDVPFTAQTIWIKVHTDMTLTDLAQKLFQALKKSYRNFENLNPHKQAEVLFNILNDTNKARLIILDQFENLLEPKTGQVREDRLGLSTWFEIMGSQQCKSKILLTTRVWPDGTNKIQSRLIREYCIKGLGNEEGVELLRKLNVEGTDAELGAIVKHYDGHPMALMLVAAFLRDYNLSSSTFLKKPIYIQFLLKDIVRNLLTDMNMQRPSAAQYQLLLALSVFRKPIPLSALEYLFKPMDPEIWAASDTLLAQHLLYKSEMGSHELGEVRYQLHAIIASYVRDYFVEGDEQARLRALRVWHEKAAHYYRDQAIKTRSSRRQRQQLSDIPFWIEAIWHLCHTEQWKEAYNIIKHERIFSDLKRWGETSHLLELCQLLLPLDKWKPEHYQAIDIYDTLGSVYRILGHMAQAEDCYKQALRMCEEVGDQIGLTRTLKGLGIVYGDLGKREEARDYLERALDLGKDAGDRLWKVRVLCILGKISTDMGQGERARAYLEQALNISQEVGANEWKGRALNSLGLLLSTEGQNDQALEYLDNALEISREMEDLRGEGWTLHNLGRVYINLDDMDQAQSYFKGALHIRREVKDRRGEGWTLLNLGKLYFQRGREYYRTALAFFLLSKHVLKEVESPDRSIPLRNIENLHEEVGEKEFGLLLEMVRSQADQIVEQALHEFSS